MAYEYSPDIAVQDATCEVVTEDDLHFTLGGLRRAIYWQLDLNRDRFPPYRGVVIRGVRGKVAFREIFIDSGRQGFINLSAVGTDRYGFEVHPSGFRLIGDANFGTQAGDVLTYFASDERVSTGRPSDAIINLSIAYMEEARAHQRERRRQVSRGLGKLIRR
ncbi:MAG TPA: hypothetical protein VFQ70_01575 [Candidatus Saccharimonadaceae bacterium]|nr:hypothetical protein [Candidatus Saccharimonadaceae bacterium]